MFVASYTTPLFPPSGHRFALMPGGRFPIKMIQHKNQLQLSPKQYRTLLHEISDLTDRVKILEHKQKMIAKNSKLAMILVQKEIVQKRLG